jgi:hypothetical protein
MFIRLPEELLSTVHIFPQADMQNGLLPVLIINLVQDTIVPDAYPPTFSAHKLIATMRPWIIGQRKDAVPHF